MRSRIIKYPNYSSAVYLLFCAVSRAHPTRPAASLPDPLVECKTYFMFVKDRNMYYRFCEYYCKPVNFCGDFDFISCGYHLNKKRGNLDFL